VPVFEPKKMDLKSESKSIPFRCESFPSLSSTGNVSINLNHKQDEHEGFLFFLEPVKNEAFPLVSEITLYDCASPFISVYGCSSKELERLYPVFSANQSAKRNKNLVETSFSVYGCTSVSTCDDEIKSVARNVGEWIQKRWICMLPDKQILSPLQTKMKKTKSLKLKFSPIAMQCQQKEPFVGMYIECRPFYDDVQSIVGLTGVRLG
jgi:hypothetical protein